MGNCLSCQAGEASDNTKRKSHTQYTQDTSFHLWDDSEIVSLDCETHAQGEHALMCSGSPGQQSYAWSAEGGNQDLLAIKGLESASPSSYRRSYAIISALSKLYGLEEDSEDQSTIEMISVAEMLDPQCPEGGSSLPNTIDVAPPSQSHGASSSGQGEGSFLLPSQEETESLMSGDSGDNKMAALLQFLASKYLKEEPTTMAEMQQCISKECDNFSVLFREATQSLKLYFGIDVKKVQPSSTFYVLVPVLGLTYDGMDSNRKGYPRTILLIIVLGIIFLQGNCAREEAIWEILSEIGVHAGEEHCIYGEPRKFITEDLVQEQYISYLVVPNSDPPEYKFQWGPRAYAETSKKEVLLFLARLKATVLRDLPVSEEEDSENEN
ncbi:melanoma-associated antigen 4 [Fukomys damarensis]|nr:melanoma-associated antigen 4 [Fukomys damarensis]XP_010624985.1 melanoma-associated antigen 4 [Fukomys damarensis]XP_010624986.1 melanoma-associated antigen 4 [Fukomys damarensis]